MNISINNLERLCEDALLQVGVDSEDSGITAQVLATTDAWGVHTHGIKALPGYIRRVEAGGLRKKAAPTILKEGPAWALVDGGSSLAMVSSLFAMDTAIAKAKKSGIGYVGVNNNCHFGAAGYYAVHAAMQGYVGFAMANDIPGVIAPGSKKAVLGTNPFAYAVPSSNDKPIFLDMATSVVAGGKVVVANSQGKKIPTEWAVDAEGNPTDDPANYPFIGALQPFGGYKGYGIGLMIELLAGCLTNAAMTSDVVSWSEHDPSIPTKHGATFMAIDVASMMSLETFHARVAQLSEQIHQSPQKDPNQPVLLPGEREWNCYEKALENGITLPDDVTVKVEALARKLAIDLTGYTA